MSKIIPVFLLIASFLMSKACLSDEVDQQGKYRLGLALALPSVGLSLQSVISNRITVAVVAGNGLQAQINFTGDSPDNGYFLLGAGRDDTIGLLRGGYGYVWTFVNWSFHLEASLNIPLWDRDLGGLANIGKVLYLFPFGAGLHYRF